MHDNRNTADFWVGFVTAGLIVNMYQDWMGKDRYITFCREHWVNTEWWMWFAALVALLVWYCWRKARAAREGR